MVNSMYLTVNDTEAKTLLAQHRQPGAIHTNLQPGECACAGGIIVKAPPKSFSSGNICYNCGGITVQTGTCTTCTSCGETGGCG